MRCAVPGCSKRAEKRSFCGAHYYRFRIHGHPLGGRAPNGAAERFIEQAICSQTDECILWPFGGHGNGYGATFPHRQVCLAVHGECPSPLHEVAHGCGRRACINPRHLRWATHIENETDKHAHGTWYRKLSDTAVAEIVALSSSLSGAAIARRFGVSNTTICNILRKHSSQ